MIAEDVKLGEAYFAEVGRGAKRRVERVIVLNSDGREGWWAYCPATQHRCRIRRAFDLSPIQPGDFYSCS